MLDLTVILGAPEDYLNVRGSLNCWRAQRGADRIEMLLTVPIGTSVPTDAGQGFASFTVIETDDIDDLPRWRAQSVLRAQAPIIVLGEDHAFVVQGTVEAYLDVMRDPTVVGTGPRMINANPKGLASWADMLINFSTWFAPVSGDVESVAGHNSCYRRAVLLDYGERLPVMLLSERAMHLDLRARGLRLVMGDHAAVLHINNSQFGVFMLHKYLGGRIFGAARAAEWSLVQRLVYVLAAPLVPLIRLRRILSHLRRSPQDARILLPRVLPLLMGGLTLHALGEAIGYLAGQGNALEKYIPIETRRRLYIREGEWDVVQRLCP